MDTQKTTASGPTDVSNVQKVNTIDCPKKDRKTPAKCCLCLGDHPANYKGCQVFLEINNRKKPSY